MLQVPHTVIVTSKMPIAVTAPRILGCNVERLHSLSQIFKNGIRPTGSKLRPRKQRFVCGDTYTSQVTIIDRPFEEADWLNAIEFPFRNWASSRFCDGSFGIWHGSDTVETTVYETVHHWRYRFLADAGFDDLVTRGTRDRITGERKVVWVRCDAALLDLRARAAEYPDLVHPTRYHLTQQIGARLHRESHPGFVPPSARCEGENYGVLNRNVLSAPRACCSLTYRLPREGVAVEREAGQTWMVLA